MGSVTSQYAVYTALSDDSHEGWIWIKLPKKSDLYNEIKDRRCIVRIKGKGAKPVYIEALIADTYYLNRRKEKHPDSSEFKNDGSMQDNEDLVQHNVIFISAWYRRLLGLQDVKKGESVDLCVKSLYPRDPRTFIQYLWALLYQYPRNHPQILVLTASMLGIIGFGLGVIGTGLGLIGINSWIVKDTPFPYIANFLTSTGLVLLGIGLVITIFGLIGLLIRRR